MHLQALHAHQRPGASVCGQGRKVKAPKSKIMKLIQKPCKFVWQHRDDGIVAPNLDVTKPDLPVIQGIESPMLAPAADQCALKRYN